MQNDLRLIILTPERKVYDEQIGSIVVPAETGLMGVLPGHAPIFATLARGKITIKNIKGIKTDLGIEDGFMEVNNNIVTVLTDFVEKQTK